jgi:hypothetical protein
MLISSSIIDEAGLPHLQTRGEQTVRTVTDSGGRLHFGMVADIKSEWATDFKSESPAGLPRNSHVIAQLPDA